MTQRRHPPLAAAAAAAVLLLCSVCIAVSSTEVESLFSDSQHVADLDSVNLRRVHAEATRCPWIILFYHSDCGHCRAMAPHYAAFAARNNAPLQHAGTKGSVDAIFGAIDCKRFEQVCLAQKIHDVPELFLAAGREPLRFYALNVTEDFKAATVQVGQLLSKLIAHHIHAGPVCRAIKHMLWTVKTSHHRLGDGNGARRNASITTAFVEDTNFYITDVANAFYYTMWYEVPTVPLVGTSRKALAEFLLAVRNNLPGLKADALLAAVSQPGADLSPVAWKEQVTAAAIPYARRGTEIAWKTCRGSSWKYRGFPCGMWLLYHALLANGLGGFAKLQAIRNYVVQFFTCSDCRSHFAQFKFDPREDAALQLWRAHNAVNERLSAVTDGADPMVPKRQFPSKSMCQSCYNGDTYLESEILHFLKARYVWNASQLMATEMECDSDGDVCLLKSEKDGPLTPAPAFRRLKRDPNFTFRIEDASVHFLLTSLVVVSSVGAGFMWGLRRRRKDLHRE